MKLRLICEKDTAAVHRGVHANMELAAELQAAADAKRLEKQRKEKEKKLRKQLAKGELSEAAAERLMQSSSGAKMTDIYASSKLDLELSPTHTFVKPNELQEVVLWLSGQMAKPRWIHAKNKGLISSVVLLCIRDMSWGDWQSASGIRDDDVEHQPAELAAAAGDSQAAAPSASNLTFLHKLPCRKLKHKRAAWNPWYKSLRPMDGPLLYLPKNAVLVDGSAVSGPAAGKRGRGDADTEGDAKDEGEEAEDGESGDRPQITDEISAKRLYSISLSVSEMAAHDFPLALPAGSSASTAATASSSRHATQSPLAEAARAALPPGRIAGVSAEISSRCTLSVPAGHILTRTAHMDLHAAFPDSCPCPVLAAHPMVEAADSFRAGGGRSSSSAAAGAGAALRSSAATDDDSDDSDAEDEAAPPYDFPGPRVIALDCEMCKAEGCSAQLARATAIDATVEGRGGEPVYDEVVIPQTKITDYLTQYSGITPDDISRATVSIGDVQDSLADILDGTASSSGAASSASSSSGNSSKLHAHRQQQLRPAVLVGHSLDNDLRSLRLIHTRVVDTSLALPHPAGLPYRFALRNLTQQHLGRAIQTNHGGSGHDSAEDATAALHLVQMLVEEGEGDGDEDVTAAAASAVDAAGAELERDGKSPVAAADGKQHSSKRQKTEDGISATPSAPPPPPPPPSSSSFTAAVAVPAFVSYLTRPPREHLLPPAPASDDDGPASNRHDGGGGRTPTSAASANKTNSSRGIAGSIAALLNPSSNASASQADATASGPATRPAASQQAMLDRRSGRALPPRARSIFLLPDMSDKAKIASLAMIGSPGFIAEHLAGSADAFHSCSRSSDPRRDAGDARRLTDMIVATVKKTADARREGRCKPGALALIVAETYAPRIVPPHTDAAVAPPSSVDLRTLDSIVGGMCASLPPGTAVVLCSQGKDWRFGGGQRVRGGAAASSSGGAGADGRMSEAANAAATDAQYGVCWLHVVNATSSSAQHAQAAAAANGTAAGTTGGGSQAKQAQKQKFPE